MIIRIGSLGGILGSKAKRDIRAFQAQREDFYLDLASAHDDGIAIADHIASSVERLRTRQPQQARVLNRILNNMVGDSLANALNGIVPDSDRIIINAAEQSGHLAADLRFLSETITQMRETNNSIKMSLTAPVITVLITWFNVWQISSGMLPLIKATLPPEKFVGMSAAMYYMAQAITIASVPVAIIAILGAWYVYRRLPNWIGRRRRRFDEYFPFSIYRDTQGAVLLVAMASLHRAGSGLKEAVSQIAETSPPWLRWHCNTILNRLALYPERPGLAFDTGVLPRQIADRLIDVADRSGFEGYLEKIGTTILKQTNKRVLAVAMRAEFVIGAIATLVLIVITLGVPAALEGMIPSAVS